MLKVPATTIPKASLQRTGPWRWQKRRQRISSNASVFPWPGLLNLVRGSLLLLIRTFEASIQYRRPDKGDHGPLSKASNSHNNLPRGSKYPVCEVSGPQNHTLNGFWEQKLQTMGTWTLWVMFVHFDPYGLGHLESGA